VTTPVAVDTERPRTTAEAAEVLRTSTGAVLIRGAGTHRDWAGRVDAPDLVLDTTALHGVLTHNPADMTASVRAGTPLRDLQQHLAADNQWLAVDPPAGAAGATVGGLLAAGDSGPSRLRYGGIRDLVIGVTLVLADGTVARAGGHVIKNVAGYDLAKLVHGSLGSLALITEVVVRLHPRPAGSVTLAAPADARQATAAALTIAAGPLEPIAVEWLSGADGGSLLIRLDGPPIEVDASTTRLTELLAGVGVRPTALSVADAQSTWAEHGAAVLGNDGDTVIRVSGRPGDTADLVAAAGDAARRAGVDVAVVSSVAVGVHTIRFHAGAAQAQARAVADVREHALSRGGSVLLRHRPVEVDAVLDPLGPPPSTAPLLRAVKATLDPAGRFAPGRFRPWY
jgi:glycolate oxidase FAD binding subunit